MLQWRITVALLQAKLDNQQQLSNFGAHYNYSRSVLVFGVLLINKRKYQVSQLHRGF